MITLSNIQRFVIYCFVFFGPLGTLLTPSFMPYAFRFYHFFLILFPLFFIKLEIGEWKTVLAFLPFLAYCLISAYFTHNGSYHVDSYPLFRCFLFISQCLFMFGAAFSWQGEQEKLIYLYLAGFFISLAIGYIFYIGYYTKAISFATINRFSVEAQIGWGLLRFSPGSYPNEYGNGASFALSVLLILYAQKKRFLILILTGLTFIALLLTTTRAAYLSFAVTLIYLCVFSEEIRKLTFKLSLLALPILFILKTYSIDFFKIFVEGVKAISMVSGSTGARFSEWIKGFESLDKGVIFGDGFGAQILAHNIYLELLFELGFIGVILLATTLFYYFSENSHRIRSVLSTNQIVVVGLIHVLLFAMSNHNMHHHLTWMVFLLFNIPLFSKRVHPSTNSLYLSRTSV